MFGRKDKSRARSVEGESRKVRIDLHHGNGIYAPGEEFVASLTWLPATPVRSIDLSIVWRTHGKGDTDSGIFAETSIEQVPSQGSYVWRVVLPRGPLTLHGQIVSIEWSIECEIGFDSGGESHEIPFQLSHSDQPVRLSSTPQS